MNNIEKSKKSYDEVPYKSISFPETHPLNQKIILGLLGFETPETEKARILEIGCSFGGNLIPFALNNKEADVIGIDLSEYQINEGKKIVEKMGIKNLKLYPINILEYNNEFGQFDYIICHGVFSWVPEAVQEKILKVIKESLVENGSAVISYNTYPGWKKLDILKDMMNFRENIFQKNSSENMADGKIEKRIGRGKETLGLFEKFSNIIDDDFKETIEIVKNKENHYLYHEYFESDNNPLYLQEFNEKLLNNDLIHICDTTLSKSFIADNRLELEEHISSECKDNNILREQYYDFIYNRQFRSSIITHKNNFEKVRLNGSVSIEKLLKYHIRKKINSEARYDDETTLLGYIDEKYPDTVPIEEIFIKFKESIPELVMYIFSGELEIHNKEVKTVRSQKTKLKDNYRKYIKTYLKLKDDIINFSNFIGEEVLIDKSFMYIMLEFDGKKTKEEIVEIIIKELKNNNEQDKNIKEILYELVENIENIIISNLMNE